MSEKIDYLKKWKHLYSPPQHPVMVDVPPIQYLMLDGRGDPNTAPAYQEAIEALYGLAYTLKFAIKQAQGVDYGVLPLEGLWWVADMAEFSIQDKSNWQWTAMIADRKSVV